MTRKRATGNAVGRLRGWGGVTGMAAACAVTASFTLLPLFLSGSGAVADASGRVPGATTQVTQVRAADCEMNPWEDVSPADATGKKLDEIRNRGHLIVGVDQNSFSWAFRAPDTDDSRGPDTDGNELKGFDIELAEAIAEDILPGVAADKRVVFRVISTADREKMLDNGDIDLVVRTMSINCGKNVSFSHPYFETAQQIIAAAEDKRIDGFDSLAGKRVCTADGSSARTAVQGKLAEKDQIRVPNQLDCLVRLQLGEADAVVTDDALAAAQVAQDPAIAFKGACFTPEYYGVAAKKGATDLVDRVNRTLAAYTGGGDRSRWTQSYKRWLEDTLPGKQPPTKGQDTPGPSCLTKSDKAG
jgi:polar amino acid transport system substrate-binding protein